MAVEAATVADRCRHRFPIFEQQVYINSCSQGALSDAVRAAYGQYLEDWDEKGAPWEYWVERQEAARAAFAGLVNAGPDEIAVTTSLSAGVSALASGLRFTKRSKVVLTDWEFPTIGQIWHAQEARGARVTHVPAADDGTIPLEHFERAIDEDTLIVSLTHVCYRNGAMLDVPAVVELAHERGALVLLDSFQAIGSLPVDVAALGVDFLGAGVLKYLLGSAGLGFFYCRRDLVERVWPTQTGWFADENLFEKPTPFPMTIYENIAFGIRLYEKISKSEMDGRVEKALRGGALWNEVKDKLNASGLSLSGGQQQRLCIARTVAVRPEVILFDEPCSALDPISTAKVEELIQELAEDYTIAIVTHNMQQAARVSDKTAFMYLGELIEFDETNKIFTSPSDRRTQDYITGRFG